MLTFERAEKTAKRLRRQPTFAEKRLWLVLRGMPHHFRRQVPIGPYVVDFACHTSKLIIEADGGIHVLTVARDAERDAWLASRGYRVLRFDNEAIVQDPDMIGQVILNTIQERR